MIFYYYYIIKQFYLNIKSNHHNIRLGIDKKFDLLFLNLQMHSLNLFLNLIFNFFRGFLLLVQKVLEVHRWQGQEQGKQLGVAGSSQYWSQQRQSFEGVCLLVPLHAVGVVSSEQAEYLSMHQVQSQEEPLYRS